MPRTASAGAALSFSLHAHRRVARSDTSRMPVDNGRWAIAARAARALPALGDRRANAATGCGNSPRFLL
ncbi:hypothetical protein DB771_24655 [Burkholderia sp. AU29985]|nr:hypothetical protein EGY28_25490 [Burkholderia dolosa]PRE47510.1 hypothetical protein C6P87_17765 [Burkholderia sp. AU12872]PUA74237.1 hypothetical protein DB771_24655 [Burkholderia sp. AU29985]